jgi:hypothetical protein
VKKIVALVALIYLSWLALTPVYYFVLGPEVAALPSHLRMSSGQSADECFALAAEIRRAFLTSTAYCERMPRWKHWSNTAQNIGHQIHVFAETKAP